MSSKLEPVIWLRVLVILAYMKGRTDVRTYVRMDVHDVMAIKPNFLTWMGYHIFLTMVLLEFVKAISYQIIWLTLHS